MTLIDSTYSYRQINLMKKNKEKTELYIDKTAIIINNSYIDKTLSVIFSLVKPIRPNIVTDTIEKGYIYLNN